MKKENEEQNEYAENVKGEHLFILMVESGKKGYFCIGCKNEMQAVKTKIIGRKSYFRHDPNDVKRAERKCVFSNQDYRHDQAVFILNRIKRIRVPKLYKYPPFDSDGAAFLIKDSEFIEAKYSRSELTFYENESGEVKFGKNPSIKSKNLLIRPDVTFFNAQNKPILLIEIVVTHAIDPEKLAKIRRLGINTVQITIPKDSLENIEKSFSKTNHIKWVYNYEEERINYVFTTNIGSEGVSQIDELQRKFFEESFECRQFQTKELIRTIRKCLESQQYRAIESDFRKEIFRVEKNTEGFRNRLEERRRKIREGVAQRFEERRKRNRVEKTRLDLEDGEFRKSKEEFENTVEFRREDLEGRYLRKKEELDDKLREIRKSVLGAEDFERSEHAIREQERKMESEIADVESRIGNNLQYRKGLPGKYKRIENQERSEVENRRGEIKEKRVITAQRYREEKAEIKIEAAEKRRSAIKKIKTRNTSGKSELSGRIKAILNAGRLFNDWDERTDTLIRNRAALECFKKGTYKNWNKT